MKFFKGLFKIILVLAILVGGLTFYSFKIEPYRLRVNEYDLNEANEESFRLVQISDLHIKEDYTYEQLVKIVDEVNRLNADVVVFTGDLYDNYSVYNDDQRIIEELSRIEAKIKKFAIWGNRDYGGGAASVYADVITAGGFELLKNENSLIEWNDKSLLFTGLDDKLLGNVLMPYGNEFLNYDYKILLSHEPDIVDHYVDYGYELSLSGHSHGGQINIPFLPFLNKWTVSNTDFATKYVNGFYNLTEDESQIIYVNTGLGTTHVSARLGVVPEISVFNISIQ